MNKAAWTAVVAWTVVVSYIGPAQQGVWSEQLSIQDVSALDWLHVYAAGDSGRFCTSIAGVCWHGRAVVGIPPWRRWQCVRMLDTAHGMLGGDSGVVAWTYDGGQTWRVRQLASGGRPIWRVGIADSTTGYALADSALWLTTDAGQSWQVCYHAPVRLLGLLVTAHEVWLSGDQGFLALSRDGGATWQMVMTHRKEPCATLAASPGGALWVGCGSVLLQTATAGQMWQELEAPGVVTALQPLWGGAVMIGTADGKLWLWDGDRWSQWTTLPAPIVALTCTGLFCYAAGGGIVATFPFRSRTRDEVCLEGLNWCLNKCRQGQTDCIDQCMQAFLRCLGR
jgi:hypothetical protein